MKLTTKTTSGSGFSLVELLVVIAVIAIIAAIAIPNIANVTGAARESSYQRNAQNIASVATSARAAGYTTAWPTDATTLLSTLTTGVSVTQNGQTMTFRVDAIPAADIGEIDDYLTITTNNVVYSPTPSTGS